MSLSSLIVPCTVGSSGSVITPLELMFNVSAKVSECPERIRQQAAHATVATDLHHAVVPQGRTLIQFETQTMEMPGTRQVGRSERYPRAFLIEC